LKFCCILQNYVSAEYNGDNETRSFIYCGGTSLSALCLAEDISYALNTNKEVTLLLDKILHSCLEGVVNYLCDMLVSNPSDVTHEMKTVSNVVAEVALELNTVSNSSVFAGELMEDNIVDDVPISKSTGSSQAIRRSSSTEFNQTFKRSKQVSNILEDVTDSQGATPDSNICCDNNISEVSKSMTRSSASACNCLSQSSERNDLVSVGRGSPRIACCHSQSTSTTTQTRYQVTSTLHCCLLNKPQSSVTSFNGKLRNCNYWSIHFDQLQT